MKKIFSIKNKYFIAFVVLIVIYFLWSVIWMGILFGNGFHYFDPEETILEKYIVIYTTQINTFLVPILRMAITGTGLKILYDILKKLDLC